MFDFDATLPLMAVQFLVLAAILNAVFYKPLTKAIEERDEYVRNNHSSARERLEKAQMLATQYEQQLGDARRQSGAIIAQAEADAQKVAAEQIAAAQKEAQQMREVAQKDIDLQKQTAMQSLEQQVDNLSRQILEKLLGSGVSQSLVRRARALKHSYGLSMMGTLLVLATAAAEVETEVAEHGFGLNFDILEANLINLAIVIGVLFYFGRGFLGNILSERRANIEAAVKEAEARQQEAAASLSDAQQKLAQAQAEAQRIRVGAEERAKAAKEAILAKAVKDVERLRAEAAKDLDSETERVIKELRQRVAAMALQQVESQLKERLDESAQNQLVDRSIALIGGR